MQSVTEASPSIASAGSDRKGVVRTEIPLRVVKKVLPDYSSFSRKRKEEGTVKVIATVTDGRVVERGGRELKRLSRGLTKAPCGRSGSGCSGTAAQ
jgi:hypothetical protein